MYIASPILKLHSRHHQSNLSQPSLRSSHHSQKGAALILALIVVVIVVLIASSMGSDYLVIFKRVENQIHSQQANAYLYGAESIARRVLTEDLKKGASKDHVSEGWLNQSQNFPLDQGAISGKLCDLQAKFNVNNLPGKAQEKKRYTPHQEMFIRLLLSLDLDDPVDISQAEDITHAVIDWIDTDSEVTYTGGAETAYYSDLGMPMRAANQPLVSAAELRWVKGMTNEIFEQLQPHVVALEKGVFLNVNTISAMVLRSINEAGVLRPLSLADAQDIIARRDGDIDQGLTQQNTGYNSVAEFFDEFPSKENMPSADYVVNSQYFLLQAEAIFLEKKFKLYSVLHRDNDGNIKTIARGNNSLGRCSG